MHLGRTLDDGCTLASAGVGACSLVELLPRLAGGGGDGGATGAESRSSYMEMYMEKKPDKVNPEEQRLARWTTCHLSGLPLAPPCAADELGNLYNKDAVLQVRGWGRRREEGGGGGARGREREGERVLFLAGA